MMVSTGSIGPFRRNLPAALMTIVLAALMATVVLIVVAIRAAKGSPFETQMVGVLVVAATYGIVGWIIASRRPDNRIGWVFLVIGLSQAISVFATTYAQVGLFVSPGSLPLADLLSWVAVWAWVPGFTFLVTLSVLLFPDGRPPSPRWRPIVWASYGVMVLLLVPVAVVSWPYRGVALLNLDPSVSETVAVAQGIQFLGVPAAVLIAPLLPAAAAIAILRYRLFEIDRLVSRTIAYGAVTGLLIAAYAGFILLLQGPLGQITSGDTISLALSSLAVAALFQPVRRRVQTVVDRRFDRARYDGERTIESFAARLRGDIGLGTVSAEIPGTATAAVRPSKASVWIRGASR